MPLPTDFILKISLLLISGGFFCLGSAAMFWAAWKAIMVVAAVDKALLEQVIKLSRTPAPFPVTGVGGVSGINPFAAAQVAPTEGAFVPYSDEEGFIQEAVDNLRRQGMDQRDIDEFRNKAQAVVAKEQEPVQEDE